MRSSPPRPQITSAPDRPRSESGPSVPTIVHPGPVAPDAAAAKVSSKKRQTTAVPAGSAQVLPLLSTPLNATGASAGSQDGLSRAFLPPEWLLSLALLGFAEGLTQRPRASAPGRQLCCRGARRS